MEEILETFLKSIEDHSWQEIDSLAYDFGPENTERTEQTRAQAVRQVESYRQKELSAIAQHRRLALDACREESRKRLLAAREECTKEAEKALLERVRAFTESDEYPKQLAALLRRGLLMLHADEAVVYLREEDRRFSNRLRRDVEGLPLVFREGQFAVGGIIVESPKYGRRVDFSFDTALDDAEEQFGEVFGLGLA